MTAHPRARRVVAGLLLALGGALVATGCGGDDEGITRDEFLDRFSESSPGDDAFNACVVDALFAQLDQEQIDSFYGDRDTALSSENVRAIQDASVTCAAEAASGPDGAAGTGTAGG